VKGALAALVGKRPARLFLIFWAPPDLQNSPTIWLRTSHFNHYPMKSHFEANKVSVTSDSSDCIEYFHIFWPKVFAGLRIDTFQG
jgi:hypothetical protein